MLYSGTNIEIAKGDVVRIGAETGVIEWADGADNVGVKMPNPLEVVTGSRLDVYRVRPVSEVTFVERPHTRDEDCTLGEDDVCVVCGVWHGDECRGCGKRGFHAKGCEFSDEEGS